MSNEVQVIHPNHAGVTVEAVGGELRITVSPATLALGDTALYDFLHGQHTGVSVEEVDGQVRILADVPEAAGLPAGAHPADVGKVPAFEGPNTHDYALVVPPAGVLERVVGESGFVSASGDVVWDLANARHIQALVTGPITSAAFTNAPDTSTHSPYVTVVLRMDATGNHMLSNLPAVTTFIGGRSYADLDTSPNAEHHITYYRVGSDWYAFIAWTGRLQLEPYVFHFKADGWLGVPVTQTEVIDVANATILGAGTVVFKQDAATITTETTFTAGTHTEFGVEAEAGQRISVPRYLP